MCDQRDLKKSIMPPPAIHIIFHPRKQVFCVLLVRSLSFSEWRSLENKKFSAVDTRRAQLIAEKSSETKAKCRQTQLLLCTFDVGRARAQIIHPNPALYRLMKRSQSLHKCCRQPQKNENKANGVGEEIWIISRRFNPRSSQQSDSFVLSFVSIKMSKKRLKFRKKWKF